MFVHIRNAVYASALPPFLPPLLPPSLTPSFPKMRLPSTQGLQLASLHTAATDYRHTPVTGRDQVGIITLAEWGSKHMPRPSSMLHMAKAWDAGSG